MSAVVYECVYSFLEHALLVSDDDLRRVHLDELSQTVVSVDYAAVQIVKVGYAVSSAVELYHRADIRRNNRNSVHDHPLGTVVGLKECLDYIKALEQLDALLTLLCCGEFLLQLCGELIEVDLLEQLLYSLRAHAGLEVAAVFGAEICIFLLLQELILAQFLGLARVDNDVLCEVQNFLEALGGDIQHLTDAGRGALEVPDMGNRSRKLDVTHTLASYLSACYLNAALLADLSSETNALVLAAVTLPVLLRTKDTLAEQTFLFRLLGTVIYGFRTQHFAVGPFSDLVGRGKSDLH